MIQPTLHFQFDARNPIAMGQFARDVAQAIDQPVASMRFNAEADTTSPRTVTVQVEDRKARAIHERWMLLVAVGDSEYGAAGTHTVTVGVGVALGSVVANKLLVCVTNDAGALELQIDATAARFVTAAVLGRAQTSGAIPIT